MPHNRLAPVILGTVLAVSLAPTSAGATDGQPADTAEPAASQNADVSTDEPQPGEDPAATQSTAENASDNADDSELVEDAAATIVRGGERLPYGSLAEAVADAQSGDIIELARDQVLDEQIVITGGIDLTLRAASPVTITRSPSFTVADGKPAGLFLLDGGASLALEGAGDTGTLTLDGEGKDSNEAIVTLRGSSALTMREGSSIVRAHCSWKPWGAVYVRSGSFVLDGGEIRDGFAMRNTAVAVEAGSSFDMQGGVISNNRASYSQTMVWTKGTVRMIGGTIEGNRSNVSNDGVVQVLTGGSLAFEGGTIGDNSPNNTFGVRVDANGSLTLGANAHLAGADRIDLAQGAALNFTGAPRAHSTTDPVEVVLSGTWADGAPVATTASSEVARDVLTRLSVKRGGASEQTASVGIDAADNSRIALASSEVAATFDVLDHPFADDLGLELREELKASDALEHLRETVDDHFGGIDTPEYRVRQQQIEHLERYLPYLNANHAALEASVLKLSELGNPSVEAQRTQQGYQFDNLDATGLYLKPDQKNEIVVYVEADDPSLLSVAWRQVGVTENNDYRSLNLGQHSKLVRGENRITVDLTGKRYGSMLYLRNDSTDNDARVRIEAADAPLVATGSAAGTAAEADASDTAEDGSPAAGADPRLGTSLGEHPFYEHDAAHPERFWTFVQDIKAYAARAQSGEVADMTLLQMGDDGHAQFATSATALAQAYAGIDSKDAAVAYIEKSNKAIQDRLEFFWAFDGYDADEADGPNAITPARVHTAFTRTVSNPSTMYAFVRYFHMPEDSAASFLSGDNMYGWGMSHEYGHMLDNNIIAVAEETNNLYSIAGARQGGIEASRAAGKDFDPRAYYHGNAMRATERRDEELARMAADPSYVPDWMNGDDWGTYIWTHVVTWWNGLHFFDSWNYTDYDFAASPYTPKIAADVERYGAYGATVRILRGDAEAVNTIKDLASNASTGEKYNRMAVAFTMGTGYNFAEYLYELGERDLAPQVMAWCAQYPSMPRKVRYFSLDTDAAILNGAKTYAELTKSADAVAPTVTVQAADNGRVQVTATMATPELQQATTAYELYRDGVLIGFSRDGSFDVAADAGANGAGSGETDAATVNDGEDAGDEGAGTVDPAAYTVVAYDVSIAPSRAANVNGPVSDEEQPGGDDEDDQPGEDEEQPGNPGDGEDDGTGGEEQPGDEDDGSDEEQPGNPGDEDDGDADQPGDGEGDAGDGEQPDGDGGSDDEDGGSDGEQPDQPGGEDGDGSDEEQPGPDGDGDTDTPEEDGNDPDGDGQPGGGDSDGTDTPEEGPGSDDDTGNPGEDQPGDSEDGPDAPEDENGSSQPGDGDSEDDLPNGEEDNESPDSGSEDDQPGAGGNLPGSSDDTGTGDNPAGGNSSTGGSAAGQTPGSTQAAKNSAGKLAQTGDTSLLTAGLAAIGSAAAFLGAALVRRFRN